MSRKLIALAACAMLFSPMAARATVVSGSFSGTLDGSGAGDITGVFGSPGSFTAGEAITGTFVYDTALFGQAVSGGTNTATGTGLGALTVVLTINGINHTFTDQTSSSVFLDDGAVSFNNEMTLNTLNTSTSGGSTFDESFTLDAQDPLSSFLSGTDLVQSFTESPFTSVGAFVIQDGGPSVVAGGGFSIDTLTLNGAQSSAPEPASMTVLLVGLAGILGVRKRRARSR
jgi:hypothetical protein